MERRVHPTFGRCLLTSILSLFLVAMASLGVGAVGERERLPTVRAIGYCGFLACGGRHPLVGVVAVPGLPSPEVWAVARLGPSPRPRGVAPVLMQGVWGGVGHPGHHRPVVIRPELAMRRTRPADLHHSSVIPAVREQQYHE